MTDFHQEFPLVYGAIRKQLLGRDGRVAGLGCQEAVQQLIHRTFKSIADIDELFQRWNSDASFHVADVDRR